MIDKKITLRFVNFSIVVVGTGFVPTSYNSDKIIEWGVIPDEWNWKVAGNVNSNLISQITFEDGRVSIKVERNKIVFENHFILNKEEIQKITTVAKGFLQRQKHLNITALGINFTFLIPVENHKTYLMQEFLKEGKRKIGQYELNGLGITLGYDLKTGGRLNINLSEGGVDINTPDQVENVTGLMSLANFHRGFTSDTPMSQIISIFNHIKEDQAMLESILKGLIK